jgi:hypothetical protein
MMKKNKRLAPLIIAISLILLMSTAYFHYYSLVEADFLYRGLKFESSDLEDLFVDKQNIWDLKPSPFFAFSLPDSALHSEITSFSSVLPDSDPSPAILRC